MILFLRKIETRYCNDDASQLQSRAWPAMWSPAGGLLKTPGGQTAVGAGWERLGWVLGSRLSVNQSGGYFSHTWACFCFGFFK